MIGLAKKRRKLVTETNTTMTKAEKRLKKIGYNPTFMLLELMKECIEVGYDTGVKMSAISKDSLLKQWFEDDNKKIAKERAANYMKLP